jgi:hypothetical protein
MKIEDKIESHLKESKMGELDAALRKIEKMTSKNDHNGARLAAAELVNKFSSFKSKRFVGVYAGIKAIHEAEGEMPYALLKYRDSVDESFFKFMSGVFEDDPSIADRIHGAF